MKGSPEAEIVSRIASGLQTICWVRRNKGIQNRSIHPNSMVFIASHSWNCYVTKFVRVLVNGPQKEKRFSAANSVTGL
jgi:hypothetical protein